MITNILTRIRKNFPNAQEVQMQEFAQLLVELEVCILAKQRKVHEGSIDIAIAKGVEEGEKLGRELERKNWLGWGEDPMALLKEVIKLREDFFKEPQLIDGFGLINMDERLKSLIKKFGGEVENP